MIEDLKVIRKEDKILNMVHRWYIVLHHGYLKGTEQYAVEQWPKVITEGLDTAYLLIGN